MMFPVVLRAARMLLLNFKTNLCKEALRIKSCRYIAIALQQGDATEPYPKKKPIEYELEFYPRADFIRRPFPSCFIHPCI